ncbi:MAG: hypothetical protein HY360_13385 [Verrucomicrobia bacterium]|nr:hypothetical protein [Verrucomicrobiota bacterium]
MTFLRRIQLLLEQTYSSTGVNLEECLVNRQRCAELSAMAGPLTLELSPEGRTFLRIVNGRLHLAIYYHPSVIAALEAHPPLSELSDQNIHPLIVFLEELNHAVHAGLLFLENRLQIGSESLLCDLELQAKVDTYLALKLIAGALQKRRRLNLWHRRWLRRRLFEDESFAYHHGFLSQRYRDANRLGLRLVRHLDALAPAQRVAFIRRFRPLTFSQKRSCIRNLR